MPGDTVVGRAGEHDITADSVLCLIYNMLSDYYTSFAAYGMDMPWDQEVQEGVTLGQYVLQYGLDTAGLYQVLPVIAEREGVPADSTDDEGGEQLAEIEKTLNDDTLYDHYLWVSMSTRDLMDRMQLASNSGRNLEELYYGEGSEGDPTEAVLMDYADNELGYYKVKHILLSTVDPATSEDLDEEAKAEKKKQAEDILAQLRASDDPETLFDELMNEHSEDPGLVSYPNGYDATKGQMYPEFEEAALALKVGEISDIVESESGYHIILRLPPDMALLHDDYVNAKMNERIEQWLDENKVESNEAFDRIDVEQFWTRALALSNAVVEELDPILNPEADSSSSSPAGSSGSSSSAAGSSGSISEVEAGSSWDGTLPEN